MVGALLPQFIVNMKMINDIEKLFEQNSNINNAIPMSKYMKNKFEFLGIKSPLRRKIQKEYLKNNQNITLNNLEQIVKLLWNKNEREYQYFALDVLEKYCNKVPPRYIELYEFLIINKSWWDTVDLIASKLVGSLLFNHPELTEKIVTKWLKSNNIWLVRTAILFQLKYKEKTNTHLLELVIKSNLNSTAFFINKAIGWILREYSKTNPTYVKNFVKSNQLSNLSRREALKWMAKQDKYE